MSVEVFEDHSPDVDITFTKGDLRDVMPHDNDPIVISLVTVGRTVHRVRVDQGSSADVMFWPTFEKLQLSPDQLRPYVGCLYGFVGDQVEVRGYIELRTTFTDGLASRTEKIRYLVVNALSAYNILLGRPTLNRTGVVPSTRHMKVKLPSMEGLIITICSDQKEAKKCYENSLKNKRSVCHVTTTPPPGVELEWENRRVADTALEVVAEGDVPMEDIEARSESAAWVEEERNCPRTARESGVARALIAIEKRPQPVEEWLEKKINDKTFKLGKTLDSETQDQIAKVISRHLDAFAWTASDMPEIDPDFLCHRLAMDPQVRPIRQRRRKFNEEKRQAIKDETQKLLAAGHIREIQYPEWLANVVLVKSSGKWRMCVDFTDLNKACPKDSYPLPSIDALVDSASGCKLLSFLDAFSGYNQIKMHPMDEEKTAFMKERSCYCYKVMPFGLKNAGATYQRLMDKVLAPMLGRNVQAYVDDMVVTSLEKSRHVADLEELFVTIARYKLKLNPEKCIFGVEAGKFLGFLLSERGIEANPNKCAAILAMRSPATVKEVQQLTGRMAALSRFVSASGEKGHPYFQCLKRNNMFVWTKEFEEAFMKLKEYLARPPVLCKPQAATPLRLYFAITERAISAVLVQDQDQVQKPIYFVSKVVQGPEVRYQALEKAALAVVFSARRLRHYFQSFTVVVMTDLPIQKVLKKPDVAGRMVKWAVELSEFDIKYEPRGPIKGQIFADFVVELSSETVQNAGDDFRWVFSVDGSSNQLGSGAGVIFGGTQRCADRAISEVRL